jgi:Lon protease-like protein
MTDDRAALDGFAGLARLFPLPNLVLFPGVDQGLHIFEPRYRQMTADALASDHLIAMVLLTPNPNWEHEYDGRPPIEPVACLGRIARSERLPDGRYNLRLRGLTRLRIEGEVPDDDKLYRLARGAVLTDVAPSAAVASSALRRELREAVLARFDPTGEAHKQLSGLFDGDAPVGEVCDLLGYALPLPLAVKQRLLGEADVTARVRLIAQALRAGSGGRHFPPPFSAN